MSSRWTSVLSLLLLISNLLVGFVEAATDDKTRLGNSTIDRTVQLRTHSLYAPYIDQDLQNRWWDFGADAYVNTYKHIRLTRNVPSQMGWLWSRLALTAANFVIEAEFKISGDSSHLYGDGVALWLTTDRAQPGPVFGSIDQFNGLGIFLDTYANGRHTYSFPRIVGILGDGKTKYDLANDGDSQAIGACSANFRRTNVATKLKVTYVKDTFLDVKIQHKAWDDWSDCFYIKDISLPANPFLGFSAMTGDVSDAHDIISVTTYSAILTSPDSPRDKHSKPRKNPFRKSASEDEDEEGSWLGFLFKLVLFGGVCAGGFYGYKEYQRRQRYGGRGGFGGLGMGGGDSFGNIYSNSKRF
ncbi:ERGIC53, mannose lectin, ER-Golgi intermediate compartment [Laccaria bicolor S238N-H82]|uniref:ERGIC53, mannose lectin, ER-Golgi intermediate compartment n=1 Tax=Laccaria bicolor (strain S238N-H82 / ATCC MYA-4686) TaxID=486041 RepID=B0DXZ9_LACBS|nr:ERGIC53, mannose lectin, ER-Golgi intermediate compartment [Laccaria bicolor S238N-H82]EDR00597.1 ERGIC53, mannose lectin, ER-Golgi intermediate compartment [Laccaria bicolor S238N-H82]|eukprot:XP_001888824.1 ERGIC53, mannose lectin, ER-Golgi intermediate compartment [Laccaria bicolor S238N-H82]